MELCLFAFAQTIPIPAIRSRLSENEFDEMLRSEVTEELFLTPNASHYER